MSVTVNAWGANQLLCLTKETTWGTYNAVGTVQWIDLFDDSAPSFEKIPLIEQKRRMPSNLKGKQLQKRWNHTFSFKTLAFPDQLVNLIPWAFNLSNLDTRNRPILDSWTADYFDGDEVRRFLGCRINRCQLVCNNQSDWVEVTFSGIAQKHDPTITTLAPPAMSVYSTLTPYALQDSAGLVKLGTSGGTVITGYSELSLTLENLLDPQFDEQTIIQSLNYSGRNIDASVRIRHDSNTYRLLYEAQNALSLYLKWSQASPAHSLTIDLQDSNFINQREVQKPMQGDEYQTLRLNDFQSYTTGADAVVTAS